MSDLLTQGHRVVGGGGEGSGGGGGGHCNVPLARKAR